MKLHFQTFHSRVARRLFLLFTLSTLIPILILAYLTYTNVIHKLDTQNKLQLHQMTKSSGLNLFRRLETLESQLKDFSDKYAKKQLSITPEIEHAFSAVAIELEGHRYKDLFNEIGYPPQLSRQQTKHLQQGNTLITIDHFSRINPRILMTTLSNGSLIHAELKYSNLWETNTYLPSDAIICVITETQVLLYCSESGLNHNAIKRAMHELEPQSSLFSWKGEQDEYLGYAWTIFLNGAYKSPSWTIILNRPTAVMESTLDTFKQIFPSVIITAVLLTMLISSSLIRRYLEPVEKLQQGTKLIASGDFQNKVHINSNDEFQELADSFNEMTDKLDKQFKSLSIMAELDGMILSSEDAHRIIETVLSNFKQIVNCNFILFTTFQNNKSPFDPILPKRGDDKTLFQNVVFIEDDDIQILSAHSKYYFINSIQHAPSYLDEIIKEGATSFVVFPVIIDKTLTALVTLGYTSENHYDKGDLKYARDLTDRIAVTISNASKKEQIYLQTNYDSLTALPNRNLIGDRLERAIKNAQQTATQLAVLLIDLDRFKDFNDSFGHSGGDQLLREIAQRLTRTTNERHILGRLSGDEFIIVLTNLGYKENIQETLALFIDNTLKAINYPFVLNDHEVNISATIGVATYPNDTRNREDLIKFAELAMYHAKSKNKGSFQLYSKDLNTTSVTELVLENQLRTAIRNDQLDLYYQPQIDQFSNQVVGAEALLRWNHGKYGHLSPAVLLPIAENSGLIIALGEWVIERTCRKIREWLDKGINVPPISINVTAKQFKDKDLIKNISQSLHKYHLDPEYLKLEITEDTIMSDTDDTMNILKTLAQNGLQLAVDDFGTGYSSLRYLAHFPIHYLKVDKSFVMHVTDDPKVASIVAAIIALAHSLRLGVIAEGVETKEQLEFLKEHDCDQLQGFYFSKPINEKDFLEFLHAYQHSNQRNFI